MRQIIKIKYPFVTVSKAIAGFFILLILLSFTPTKPALKGRVRSLIRSDYQILWDSIIHVKLSNKEITEYDKSGNETMYKRYYTSNVWQDSIVSEYNSVGLLIGEKHYNSFRDSFFLAHNITYRYDDMRRKIELKDSAMPPNKSFKTVYKYGADSKPTETQIYNADGTLRNIDPYKRDSVYTKYDARNHVIEKGNLFPEGYKHIFRYDTLGYLIEYETYNPDGRLEKKHVIGLDKNRNGFDTTYTDKGVTDISITKYTYDKIGNWTIDSTFVNDTLTYIRTQQIEYY